MGGALAKYLQKMGKSAGGMAAGAGEMAGGGKEALMKLLAQGKKKGMEGLEAVKTGGQKGLDYLAEPSDIPRASQLAFLGGTGILAKEYGQQKALNKMMGMEEDEIEELLAALEEGRGYYGSQDKFEHQRSVAPYMKMYEMTK